MSKDYTPSHPDHNAWCHQCDWRTAYIMRPNVKRDARDHVFETGHSVRVQSSETYGPMGDGR